MLDFPLWPLRTLCWARNTSVGEQVNYLQGKSEANTSEQKGGDFFAKRVRQVRNEALYQAISESERSNDNSHWTHKPIGEAELNRRSQRNTLIFTILGFIVGGSVSAWIQSLLTSCPQ